MGPGAPQVLQLPCQVSLEGCNQPGPGWKGPRGGASPSSALRTCPHPRHQQPKANLEALSLLYSEEGNV